MRSYQKKPSLFFHILFSKSVLEDPPILLGVYFNPHPPLLLIFFYCCCEFSVDAYHFTLISLHSCPTACHCIWCFSTVARHWMWQPSCELVITRCGSSEFEIWGHQSWMPKSLVMRTKDARF